MSDDKLFLPRRNRGHAQLLFNLLQYLEFSAVARPKLLPSGSCTPLPRVPRLEDRAPNLPCQVNPGYSLTLQHKADLSSPGQDIFIILKLAVSSCIFVHLAYHFWMQSDCGPGPCQCVKTSPSTGLCFPTKLIQSLTPGHDNAEVKFTRVQNRFYPDQISQS